jgi:signal peptidase II
MTVLLSAILITVADQASKQWVRWSFGRGESRPVVEGFFNFTYLRNTGAAWGLLDGHNYWLGILSVLVLAGMLIFRRSFLTLAMEHKVALGLLTGGILGNLIDRIRLGYVTDFLDFHIAGHHWPCFNIADMAIVSGVGIYLISSLWVHEHPLRDNGAKAN